MTSSKSVIILYLEDDPSLTAKHEDLLATLGSKYELQLVYTKEVAFPILSDARPATVLVLDAGITKPENSDIANRLVSLAWGGSTVILAGGFSGANEKDMMKLLERIWGLPWKYHGMSREFTSLTTDMVRKRGDLLMGYYQEAVFMGIVEGFATWYGTGETEAKDRGAAVVFMGYGGGKLGYVGDMKIEEGTKLCIMRMLEGEGEEEE
ncbi:uncharacterized protein DNG_00696 [Cephalotrichum gorgonifer]|uniref:Uncharacterized protein n=1 Tax=Cephalotrichum gorgonifer TaxID=2041049 RepID=A0AAE8SR21_9PEZI|nr:uncharacterized protein DNG_00696 [Cephalotrichum gorgonifer]